MTDTPTPTTSFRVKPWMIVLALIMIIGALYNAVSPDDPDGCERAWRDNETTSAVGHDEYIRNCREAKDILGR